MIKEYILKTPLESKNGKNEYTIVHKVFFADIKYKHMMILSNGTDDATPKQVLEFNASISGLTELEFCELSLQDATAIMKIINDNFSEENKTVDSIVADQWNKS